MKGEIKGTFLFRVDCDLKKDVDSINIEEITDEILEVISDCLDVEVKLDYTDIDTEESFIVYGKYDLEGYYTSYPGDRINPPEFESEYSLNINESKILKLLQDKYNDYSFKADFEEYPDEEEIL